MARHDHDEVSQTQAEYQKVTMTKFEVESYVLSVLVHSVAPFVGVEGITVGAEYC